jgi:secernin
MCDTIVALGNATVDGSVIFAKNSDREPNEAQEVIILPRQEHPEGSSLRCTYIEIPQVSETHAVLLCKPFWMWGAEMGANEHGVAIGNEAVFTKIPYEKETGLTGMDLLRLALERAATAQAALEVITKLIAQYGQGGNCGLTHPLYYHNSYIIADPHEAWVLETAGKEWAAERVTDVRSISNAITIGNKWDLASPGLVDYALERGWCKKREDFDFGKCYSDFLYTSFSDARKRQCRSQDMVHQVGLHKAVTVKTMLNILRDHGTDDLINTSLRQNLIGADVCMHAGFGPIRVSQSTGSLVCHLRKDRQTLWITGTSAPCTSVFKPVWIEAGMPEIGPSPEAVFNADSLWWRHEALHREILHDYPTRISLIHEERDALENSFLERAEDCQAVSPGELAAFTKKCFLEADEALKRWTDLVNSTPPKKRSAYLFRTAWRNFNRQAKYPS